MLFKILINYIIGYLNIEVEGYYIERFINSCMNREILLWGTKRKSSSIFTTNISAGSFREIKNIAKKHQCNVKIKNKKGIPFFINAYKKRKGFIICLFVLIAIIIILSKFIWNIEVIGNKKIDSNEIIAEVKKEGLTIGKLKDKVDTEKVVKKIRMKRNDLAWIGIEIKGTNAIIKIVEADEKPEIINENDFTNIVANKDGVIQKAVAQNGTVMVKEGDEVKKGDVLIAGYMEGNYTDKYYVNSIGSVKAKITYSQSEKIDKKELKRVQTGRIEKKYSIKFNNFKINFYKGVSKFEKYDTIYANNRLKIFSNFYLPIEIIKCTNYEVLEEETLHNYEEAKTIGEEKATEKLDSLINGDIINKTTNVIEYDAYYKVNVTYEVIEEIGTKEKIEI